MSATEPGDVTVDLGLDTADPTVFRDLVEASGLNFTLRAPRAPSALLAALGPGFARMLRPNSATHFVCGPADQRCLVQVLDLGAESLVVAVCTGEGNASNQSMQWVLQCVARPMEEAARATGGRFGRVSSGQYGEADADLRGRIAVGRVVPVGSLERREERERLKALLAELRDRFLAFANGGPVDASLVLGEEVEGRAGELWRLSRSVYQDRGVPLEVVDALAWLHWSRYSARPTGRDHNDLQAATVFFAQLYRARPAAVPDELVEELAAGRANEMQDELGLPAWHPSSYSAATYPAALEITVAGPEEEARSLDLEALEAELRYVPMPSMQKPDVNGFREGDRVRLLADFHGDTVHYEAGRIGTVLITNTSPADIRVSRENELLEVLVDEGTKLIMARCRDLEKVPGRAEVVYSEDGQHVRVERITGP